MLLKYKKIEKRKAERNEQLASKKVKSSFSKGHKFSKYRRALKMRLTSIRAEFSLTHYFADVAVVFV